VERGVAARWIDPARAFAGYANTGLADLGRALAAIPEKIVATSFGQHASDDRTAAQSGIAHTTKITSAENCLESGIESVWAEMARQQ